MKIKEEIYCSHQGLISEVKFLKTEITFLLKLLNKCYRNLVNHDKVRILDSFWSQFEKDIDKLDVLLKEISKKEEIHQKKITNPPNTKLDIDCTCVKNFFGIEKEIKILKEKYYEFMIKEIANI